MNLLDNFPGTGLDKRHAGVEDGYDAVFFFDRAEIDSFASSGEEPQAETLGNSDECALKIRIFVILIIQHSIRKWLVK